MAIAKWEPRFALTGINISDLTVQGAVTLQPAFTIPTVTRAISQSMWNGNFCEHHSSKDIVMSRRCAKPD